MTRPQTHADGAGTLSSDEVLAEYKAAGAFLDGHFVLSSGRHSGACPQCARLPMDAARAERLCRDLAARVRQAIAGPIDMVASPAMGGAIVGYEMGRQPGVPAIFFERIDGKLALRRGFDMALGTRCLMVEDIVTTGQSSRQCIAGIAEAGGVPAAPAGLPAIKPGSRRLSSG